MHSSTIFFGWDGSTVCRLALSTANWKPPLELGPGGEASAGRKAAWKRIEHCEGEG